MPLNLYSPAAPLTNDERYRVLFLCTGNSARSIMAECILNREGGDRFVAFSAGSDPKGAIHPRAKALLERKNYVVDGLRSKSWAEFSEAGMRPVDFVITVCDRAAKESCPVWPGRPMSAHWGVPDPAAVAGTEAEEALAFAEAYRMLWKCIGIFVNLPMASLDRMSLQRRLEEIGRAKA